jgi:hypothetical protein
VSCSHLNCIKIEPHSCRLAARNPLEATEAYVNLRPHKDHAGEVYTHLHPNCGVLENAAEVAGDDEFELDWVDLKVGVS